MVISDTSCMIEGLPLLYWHWNLGKSGQSMCVMTLIFDFQFQFFKVTPQLWRKSKHSGG